MKIDLARLNLTGEMSDGEAWLCRVADALESGEMPKDADIERLADAAELLRLQVHEKEPPEQRRADLLRKLGFPKAAHRQKDDFDFRGKEIAEDFWMEVFSNNSGINEALGTVAEEHGVSEQTVRKKKDAHIKQARLIVNLLNGVVPEDDPRWINLLAKYQETVRRIGGKG